MKRLLFPATLLVLLIPCRADAFIFTDLVAQAQRITMIEQAAQHLEHIDSYRKEFDKYKKLDPSKYEVFYWSDGGLRRILRSVADQYTYWLATTDARERTIKRLMKQLHGGSVRHAIEDLVRLTGHCRDTDERLAILEPYLEERLAEQLNPTVGEAHTAATSP